MKLVGVRKVAEKVESDEIVARGHGVSRNNDGFSCPAPRGWSWGAVRRLSAVRLVR